jgi:single-stranded-DNA-specific exonuclease
MYKNSNNVSFNQKWKLVDISDNEINELASKLNIRPILAKILIARNIGNKNTEEILKFLHPAESLITDTKNISTEEEIYKAITRIQKALATKEPILVNGDPDADGITGVTILVAALRYLGANVSHDFPIRPVEGHGLKPRIIDDAHKNKVKLIVTTDCGTKELVAINYAKSLGIDVIVTDHHILGKKLPEAHAIINPYLIKGPSLHKKLSGAAVAFKLVLAIFNHLGQEIPEQLYEYLLSLAALGTISDRMPLTNIVNRAIVLRGVEEINKTKKAGLKALRNLSSAGITVLKPRDISRTIIPRLNAPGRIGNPKENIPDSKVAVELLLLGSSKKNQQKANKMLSFFNSAFDIQKDAKHSDPAIKEAALVEDVNEQRKYITSKIEDQISKLIKLQANIDDDKIIIIKGKNWNPGVIGIDTDRLKEKFRRPAIILTEFENSSYLRGSVRSVPTIDIYSILDNVADIFEEKYKHPLFKIEVETDSGKKTVSAFGGHSQACGFCLHQDDVENFKKIVYEEIEKVPMDNFNYTIEILDTVEFNEVTSDFLQKIEEIEPFGQTFEFPFFLMRNCCISKPRAFGNKYQELDTPHVEFSVSESPAQKKAGKKFKSVGFNLHEKYLNLTKTYQGKFFDIIFTIERCKKKSKGSLHGLQLVVQDLRAATEINGNR